MQSYEKAIITLEFNKICELLADKSASDGAKAKALALRPEQHAEDAIRLMEQTSAAVKLSAVRGGPSFTGTKDVSAALARAELGGILNMKELLNIGALLRASRNVREYRMHSLENKSVETTCLDFYFESLRTNPYFEGRIESCILSEDEMCDNASTTLAGIRRGIRSANARIRETLQRMISSPTYSKILQDNLITMRSGRYVLPVRSEHKGDMPGLVHDVSSSGATMFIEPMPVVEANNEIQTLLSKEHKEIERILAELSNEAATFAESINDNYSTLSFLDLVFAKAQLAYDMEASCPALTDKGGTELHKARHPLIQRDSVVPIDIAIGTAYDTLVITGPNTGGKTVSIKTLGLLSMMAASGMYIPVSDGSTCRVFQRIFADIGDEQSIEQSLSTFSSHMTNIVDILSAAGEGSLVLCDELGAGTDPVEGAALAVSIIESARNAGAFVAATTHYAELKVYALKTDRVENASCEFDVATLRPTYRLLTGIPGKSNAFAIAKRIGLSPDIIEHARDLVAGENIRFEDVIDNLEKNRQAMEAEKLKAEQLRREIEQLTQRAREREKIYEREKEKQIARARAEALEIVDKTRAQADAIFAELEEVRKKQNDDTFLDNVNRARAEVRGALNRMGDTADARPAQPVIKAPKPPRPLKAGDTVELVRVGKRATVLAPTDKNGNVKIQAGIMKITAKQSELKLILEDKVSFVEANPPPSVYIAPPSAFAASRSGASLDLRGKSVDEALLELDQFIDDSIRTHMPSVTVIHGKGTGAIRSAVQQSLRNTRGIKSFRLGKYGEGEDGVTIVEIE